MNEENFVKLFEEVLQRQLEPIIAVQAQHSATLAQHSAILERHSQELSEIRAAQDAHTRLLTVTANTISALSDKIIDLSIRVDALERKAG